MCKIWFVVDNNACKLREEGFEYAIKNSFGVNQKAYPYIPLGFSKFYTKIIFHFEPPMEYWDKLFDLH